MQAILHKIYNSLVCTARSWSGTSSFIRSQHTSNSMKGIEIFQALLRLKTDTRGSPILTTRDPLWVFDVHDVEFFQLSLHYRPKFWIIHRGLPCPPPSNIKHIYSSRAYCTPNKYLWASMHILIRISSVTMKLSFLSI